MTTKDTKSTKMEFDELSNRVICCAIKVHRYLGPGRLESTCEQCLAHELNRNGIAFQLQHPHPVQYNDVQLDCGYRIDILVENELIVELESVEEVKGIHEAQLLTGRPGITLQLVTARSAAQRSVAWSHTSSR